MNEEKIIVGAKTKYPLNGLLCIPNETNGLIPAVVLVHGSGPSTMDGRVGENYPFRDIAEGLSARGIATIRYDKRTLVYGKQMKHDKDLSVKEETIEDAILATELLRQDPRIDSNKLFIIGHSLGGMLAPRIDAEGGNFAGVIILGGSPRTLEEIMMDQNTEVLNSLNKFLKMIAGKQLAKMSSKFDGMYNMTDEEAQQTIVLGKYVTAYYFKEMGEHPASQYVSELDKPLLILQGEKDFQVTAETDFEGYKNLLCNKPNVTFTLYPNLNHLFMPSIYGTVIKAKKEYNVPQHVDQKVLDDIADWIHSVFN
ncbi:alpha/beta hydrolase [Sporosarcina sp. P13]|uniref:alpha/beta hydrolase family protein n=1 Tax=Sporosarcina sp. P13 TaxID=2048263 RepID=UPI000C16B5CF|nr:alpha/beta fold hydrolase [Sporosarcina sp. P13]PIC63182.1 alpha/beta hydrolase [Sporosarcina sp. P13]